jgi:hypothetical protein
MFEIDDPARRDAALRSLGRVDDHFFLRLGDNRIAGTPEGDIERTRDDGKTSSVHFLRFTLSDEVVAAFRDPTVPAMIGCDHPSYGHLAMISPDSRAELARDFA